MDGWPAMETDAGRAVMKTPATSATTFVLSGAAHTRGNQTLFPELSTITWQRGTRSDLHALDAATHIVLISITYQSHRAGSIVWLVRSSLGHCLSLISSRPDQAPTQI